MIERENGTDQRIDADVLRFFQNKAAPFGCTNVLDVHFPTTERVTEIVCNALTVEFAISKAYKLPAYEKYISDFATGWARSISPSAALCSAPKLNARGWFSSENGVYARHLEHLRTLDVDALRNAVQMALCNCIDAIHLFCAKQCNMACTGCYASAVPIDKHPYKAEDINYYYSGAKKIIAAAARRLGADTIQTSGDGELTIFPRFFDLLEWAAEQKMQWLIFTAGLIFSNEEAAKAHWLQSADHLSLTVRSRIQSKIDHFTKRMSRKPTVHAFLSEIARHRDHLHIYHSVWSTRSSQNTAWRKPRFGDYEYVDVKVRGRRLSLPSSLLDLMEIFSGDHRNRIGIDFPVSRASIEDVAGLAGFVAAHDLRSYFEPIILTGRARRGAIGGQIGSRCASNATQPAKGTLEDVSSLMVRTTCSFRFIHQPIIKFRSASEGFFATPGTGVDLDDLAALGVLSSVNVEQGGLFRSIRSPLIIYANYKYVSGCKCNDFSQRMLTDRAALAAEWGEVVSSSFVTDIAPELLLDRLRHPEFSLH